MGHKKFIDKRRSEAVSCSGSDREAIPELILEAVSGTILEVPELAEVFSSRIASIPWASNRRREAAGRTSQSLGSSPLRAIRTTVSTLLTFCPPFPPERNV